MTIGLELDVFVAPPRPLHRPSFVSIRPIDLNLWKSMSKSSSIEATERRMNELVLAPLPLAILRWSPSLSGTRTFAKPVLLAADRNNLSP